MVFTMKVCVLAVMVVSITVAAAFDTPHAGICYSKSLVKKKVQEMRKIASGIGTRRSYVDCLAKFVMNIPMEIFSLGDAGEVIECLPHDDLSDKMIDSATPNCFPLLENSTERLSTIRVPVSPDAMASKVAGFFGLELMTTERASCGSCHSGCHHCCLHEPLGGGSRCFEVYCSGGWGQCGS